MSETPTYEFDAELLAIQTILNGVVASCVQLGPLASLPFYQALLKSITDKRIALRTAHALTGINDEVYVDVGATGE
jgi:hypothetical protein